MDAPSEIRFKRELFDAEKIKKNFIPKDGYYKLVEEVKADKFNTKNTYYLLSKKSSSMFLIITQVRLSSHVRNHSLRFST